MWSSPQGLSKVCAADRHVHASLAAPWMSGCGDHLLSDDAVVGGAMPGSELGAVARSFDDDLVGGVGQAVQRRIAENGIVEQAQPFVHAAVRGDGEARSSVTLDDQLVQIVALLRGQAAESKIVKDDKIWSQVAAEDLVVAAVRACLA